MCATRLQSNSSCLLCRRQRSIWVATVPLTGTFSQAYFSFKLKLFYNFHFQWRPFFWSGGSTPSCHSFLGSNPWTSLKRDKMGNASKGMAYLHSIRKIKRKREKGKTFQRYWPMRKEVNWKHYYSKVLRSLLYPPPPPHPHSHTQIIFLWICFLSGCAILY